MRNVHDDAPVLLRTRWALSYLRGPLTIAEIARFGAGSRPRRRRRWPSPRPRVAAPAARAACRRLLDADRSCRRACASISWPRPARASSTSHRFGARVRTHFVDARAGVDLWTESFCLAPLGEDGPDWERAETCEPAGGWRCVEEPAPDATFRRSPAARSRRQRRCSSTPRALVEHVYRTSTVSVLRCPALKAGRRARRERRRVPRTAGPVAARKARRGRRRAAPEVRRGDWRRSRTGNDAPNRNSRVKRSRPATRPCRRRSASAAACSAPCSAAAAVRPRSARPRPRRGASAGSARNARTSRTRRPTSRRCGSSSPRWRPSSRPKFRRLESDVRPGRDRDRNRGGEAAQVRHRGDRPGAGLAAGLT